MEHFLLCDTVGVLCPKELFELWKNGVFK
jgi:hypothetical protein